MSFSLRPHGLRPARLLCPRDFPGKNTGVGCCFLLQGIFLTQGSNPHLLHWQVGSLAVSHLGSPFADKTDVFIRGDWDADTPRERVRMQGEDGHLQAKERGFRKDQFC